MARSPVDRFEARVRAFIADTQLLPVDARVLCAVSGGADSMALLHALHRMRRTLKVKLVVAHVDHALRGSSALDAERVAQEARSLDLPFATRRLELAPGSGTREAAAREARHAALDAMADEHHAHPIALGHTATDRAETWLYFATRGAGRRGLSSMRAREGRRVRPLLEVTRDEVRAYADALGLRYADDPTNTDRTRARNRIRLDVLPALRAINPEVDRHLAALARDFESEEAWLDEAGRAFVDAHAHSPVAGVLTVPAADLAALPRSVAARAAAALWMRVAGPGGRDGSCLSRPARLAVLALAARSGHREATLPRARASREGGLLVLRAWPPAPATVVAPAGLVPLCIDGPGRYTIPDGINVDADLLHGMCTEVSAECATFDAAATPFPLWLRPPQRGDRMRLANGGRQRVSEQLKDAKVPRTERASFLVLADRQEVLWVPGLRPPQTRRPHAATETTLRVQVRGLMFVDRHVKQVR